LTSEALAAGQSWPVGVHQSLTEEVSKSD